MENLLKEEEVLTLVKKQDKLLVRTRGGNYNMSKYRGNILPNRRGVEYVNLHCAHKIKLHPKSEGG